MVNTGKQYEKLTQAVFNHINNANREYAETIEVKHDVILQGKDTSHQIDVYWEFKMGVVTHRVIIQAKELKNKVSKGQMLTFKGVISDLPGTVGIFVTNVGYQKGAREVAVANGIYTYELRKPKDSDWEGLIKTIVISMHFLSPIFQNIHILLDKNWADANGIDEQQIGTMMVAAPNSVIVNSLGEEKALSNVFNAICNEIGVGIAERNIKYDIDTYLRFPDGAAWKIIGFSGKFGLREYTNDIKVDGGNLIDHILMDVSSGELQMFNDNVVRSSIPTKK